MKRLLCLILVLMMAGATVRAQQPADQAETALGLVEKRDQLKENWKADKDANNLDDARQIAELLADLERKLVRQVEQEEPDDVERLVTHRRELAETLNWLAREYEYDNDFDRAASLRKEHVGLLETNLGKTHWRVISDNLYLDFVELLSQKTPAEHQQIAKARKLFAKGKDHRFKNLPNYEEAIKAFQERLLIQQQVLGEDDYQTVSSRTWLAMLYEETGDYAKAVPLYQQALEINLKYLGADHPNVATVCNNFAVLYRKMGNYEEAKRLYEQSLEVNQKVLGEGDPVTVTTLANLAQLSTWLGEYAQAKRNLTSVLQIREEVLGNDHCHTAESRQNLALLYTITGDDANAERLYRQALTILDEPSNERAQVLENMGVLYKSMGGKLSGDVAKLKYEEAEKKFHEALTIYNKIFANNHQSVIVLRNNLALLHKMRGDDETDDDDEAYKCYHAALEQYKKILGEELFSADGSFNIDMLEDENLSLALTLNNLASLYESQGNFAQAEPLYQKALEIRQQRLGTEHIETAVSLSNLGLLKLTLGHHDEAKNLIRKSLSIRRHTLDAMATVQTERQQLLMNKNLRGALDDWLSVVNDESAYAEVLRWKGAVFVRQAHLRALRSKPELASRVNELRSVSCALAKLSLTAGNDEESRNELTRLIEVRQQLEIQLTDASEIYRKVKEQAASGPTDVQKVLLEKTALVDFLEYDKFIPPSEEENKPRWERRFVCFVVRPDRQQIQRFELGSAKTVDDLVDDWRRQCLDTENSPLMKPAQELYRRLWLPLEPHLKGIETVLISPDGSLGKLPFAALPAGTNSEAYLLEKIAVVTIPVPQSLLTILGPNTRKRPEFDMLVIGGINYGVASEPNMDTSTKTTAKFGDRGGPRRSWDFLPGSAGEGLDVQNIFMLARPQGTVRFLQQSAPTEELIKELAPQYRYLHFATHGYFAPPELRSALDTRHDAEHRGSSAVENLGVMCLPSGALSGLALAGANNPGVGEDGTLTALEVDGIDFSKTSLVMLSACETGLGRVAGGEGVLGLQRSFHLAGTRSVVATLWEVDDSRTRDLMGKFYKNYWGGQLSTVQCLRQAQLELLKLPPDRGIRLGNEEAKVKTPRLQPKYWAAFVLSGHWR